MGIFSKTGLVAKSLTLAGAFALALGSSAVAPEVAEATPPKGLVGEVLAAGLLQSDFRVELRSDDGQERRIKDVRKIVTAKFTIQPGGHFGWHTHGGPLWGVVVSGEATLYRKAGSGAKKGNECEQRSYGAGETLFDPGDQVHIGVNTGPDPVVIIATLMLPIDGLPRLDAAYPGACPTFAD